MTLQLAGAALLLLPIGLTQHYALPFRAPVLLGHPQATTLP